ncbi:MAG TPA: F0F1 ATP synthase subunit A [Bdellovibrionota bacterium]|jgi:F-type H+-transporting ATPase subunit a|nr:F0F1 ATP synthase subunit A [Bdellovibrionota bacterium]
MAAGHGFQWWNLLHNDFLNHNAHFSAAAVTVLGLGVSGIAYAAIAPKLKPATTDAELVPPAKLGLTNFFDLVGSFIQSLAKDIIGHHYATYLPLLTFMFIWTLTSNMLGLIPGLGSPTDNLNTTLAMGVFVFLYYNYQGFRSHGFHYLEQFAGHLSGVLLLLLGPMMFVIELISHSVRPITLGIRLKANISADHAIYGTIRDLCIQVADAMGNSMGAFGKALGWVFISLGPVPIVILGILVCVIQAFVFTLLTTIYIGLATAHEEH